MLVFRDDYYVLPGPILPVPPLREAVQFEGVHHQGMAFARRCAHCGLTKYANSDVKQS
jgi:hypothetical protein